MFTKNTKQLLNQNWQFTKQPLDVTDISQISPQTPWQTLTLPHDWLIYDTTNLYEDSVGFYKRTFVVNSDLPKHFLRFNGVYMDCSVFVNEKHVGDWKYGYTGFEFEITEHLQKGENRVLVRAIHEKNNSRWYSGAGIYRDVYLVSTNETYIPYGGVYISSKKNDGDEWSVNIETEIAGNTSGVEVKHKAYYKDEHLEDLSCVKNPLLWSVDSPNIYTMVTEVFKNNALVHTEQNTFGFREISFRKEEGFFLNGKQMKIQGVCQHHDLGALGAAFSKSALKRQFELLKEMGVNGLRAAHNPPDPYFMELADSMGFVVVSELFDIWERPKTQNDYSRFFGEWWKKDVAAWVKRDRNHPSLIMWSIGNEVYDTHADPVRGGEILTMLSKAVREYDPNKNAPITLCSNYLPWENTQKVADMLEEPKLVGYNYGEYLYEDHNKTKDWIIYGSETGSVVQSRGIYHFPLSQSVLADDDEQCSSLGNSATSWGAKSTQACIITDRDTPFSLGQFIWTGTDYIGEPTPYHTKNSYFGQIDTAGFKKDSFYIYQSAWTDYKKSPMIHIFPYWDFSPGQMIDVQVASNAPIVELFLNGQTQGTFEIDHKNGKKIIAAWRIPYQKGELKAVGYDKKGNVIAEQTKKSFGCAKNLQITETVYDDLVFAQICAFDENGIEVENANNPVIVEVTDGKLLGLDNGDSTDYDQYVGSKKRLFSGKLLAIATKGSKISAKFDEEVPIRKIELVRSGYKVKAVTYPANATHKDLHWRVTCAAGIDTNIADFAISECGRELTLTPRGDGEIFVRCSTKNGRNKISLISYLDFVITGLGKAYLDPYGFVAGGLYNKSNMPLTNGN
ncbi:MAG: DUF4982 domain-containing protein, partial [Defluviitaleaceae bacterium]|nr:DUF4982 domain-containing protein [Defluviitaleaceae bacterium]